MVSVAADTGQSASAVYEQSYALTLYSFYLLDLRSRREQAREAQLIQTLVNGVSLAVNDPRELKEWGEEVERAYGLLPPRNRAAERVSMAERVARTNEALAKGKRIDVR